MKDYDFVTSSDKVIVLETWWRTCIDLKKQSKTQNEQKDMFKSVAVVGNKIQREMETTVMCINPTLDHSLQPTNKYLFI